VHYGAGTEKKTVVVVVAVAVVVAVIQFRYSPNSIQNITPFPITNPSPKNMKVSFLCNLLQILKQQDFLKWAIQKRQTIFVKPSLFNTVETTWPGLLSCLGPSLEALPALVSVVF